MLVILLINLICAALAPAQRCAVSGFVFAPPNKDLDSSPLWSPPEKTFRLNVVFFCLCQSFHCLFSFILPLPSSLPYSPQRCNRMHLFLYFSFTIQERKKVQITSFVPTFKCRLVRKTCGFGKLNISQIWLTPYGLMNKHIPSPQLTVCWFRFRMVFICVCICLSE